MAEPSLEFHVGPLLLYTEQAYRWGGRTFTGQASLFRAMATRWASYFDERLLPIPPRSVYDYVQQGARVYGMMPYLDDHDIHRAVTAVLMEMSGQRMPPLDELITIGAGSGAGEPGYFLYGTPEGIIGSFQSRDAASRWAIHQHWITATPPKETV